MMISVMVWLLVVTSNGYYNRGSVYVLERFATADHCTFVQKNLPLSESKDFSSSCIQATILVEKK